MNKIYDLLSANKVSKGRNRSASLPGLQSAPGESVLRTLPPKPSLHLEEPKDTIGYFERQDLSRSQFSYDTLVDILWWPDLILTFLKINRLAYIEFIHSYTSQDEIFDKPLREAVYYMIHRNYCEIPEISAFIKLDDSGIPDHYLNRVVNEDNCYMHEIEERHRSPNEKKHYLLIKALMKLMSLAPIGDESSNLDKESEKQVRIFLLIYKIKNQYAVVDNALRKILSSALEKFTSGLMLPCFLRDLIGELDDFVETIFKSFHDDNLYTKIYTFRDLLIYACQQTSDFERIFSGVKHKSFSQEDLQRADSIYQYYHKLLSDRQAKSVIIEQNKDFEVIRSKLEGAKNKHIETPKYTNRYDHNGRLSPVLLHDEVKSLKRSSSSIELVRKE